MAGKPKKPKDDAVPPAANVERQRALGVNIDEKLALALDDYIRKSRPKPTKTAVVEAALEDFLRAHDALPPGWNA